MSRSTRLARRALRGTAAFLWSVDDHPATLLSRVGHPTLEMLALDFCRSVSTSNDPLIWNKNDRCRDADAPYAWIGIMVDLGWGDGILCVADSAPRLFGADDVTVIEAIGADLEQADGVEPASATRDDLLDLSVRLLDEVQGARMMMGRGDMLAAADSLDQLARQMRDLASIPAPAAGSLAPCSATPALAARAGASILLADDLDLNRKLIADLLSIDGHDVDCVEDGAAAVRAVAAKRYDLVLMDMVMPEMDGLAATRAIRALPGAARDVPIVALTANVFPEHLSACLEAGMNAAVPKPITLDSLSSVVAEWTSGRHAAA